MINANYSMLMHTIISDNFVKASKHSKNNHIMKADVLVRFGQNVQRIRKGCDLSQEELAERAGLHRTYIGMIERAEKNITLCNIEKIAKALNVDILSLLSNEL